MRAMYAAHWRSVTFVAMLAASACSKETPKAETASDASTAPSSTVGRPVDALNAAMLNAPGATPCERRYGALVPLRDSLEKSGAHPKPLPAKDAFLAECAKLPNDLQQCQDPAYVVKHGADCDAARKHADPAVVQRWSEFASLVAK